MILRKVLQRLFFKFLFLSRFKDVISVCFQVSLNSDSLQLSLYQNHTDIKAEDFYTSWDDHSDMSKDILPSMILLGKTVMYCSRSSLVCSWWKPRAWRISWTMFPTLHRGPTNTGCSAPMKPTYDAQLECDKHKVFVWPEGFVDRPFQLPTSIIKCWIEVVAFCLQTAWVRLWFMVQY